MRKGYTDLPGNLASLIGKETIRQVSQKSGIAQHRWEFDMFLDLAESNSYKLKHWIIKHDFNPEKRIRVNFDYTPYYEHGKLRLLAEIFLSYYKLNKMFAELNPRVEWSKLKDIPMVDGLTFSSWVTFFELAFPNDYLFFITQILKNLNHDQTRAV